MIRKTSQGHQVVSKSGKPLSKPNLTKSQAQARLRQVEYYKNKKWQKGTSNSAFFGTWNNKVVI